MMKTAYANSTRTGSQFCINDRSYSRWLNLNPSRARPPATMTATQLTDFGTDQSPTMRVHSSKIRTKWKSATTAKTRPAIKENAFFVHGADQLNRCRTLVGVATNSRSLIAIKYENELPVGDQMRRG